MTGVVVRTVEELKSVGKDRAYPTIIIEGELANNLLISGVVRAAGDGGGTHGQVIAPKEPDPLIHPITQILERLSHANRFEIVEDNGQKRIKIYPKPLIRREGN